LKQLDQAFLQRFSEDPRVLIFVSQSIQDTFKPHQVILHEILPLSNASVDLASREPPYEQSHSPYLFKQALRHQRTEQCHSS